MEVGFRKVDFPYFKGKNGLWKTLSCHALGECYFLAMLKEEVVKKAKSGVPFLVFFLFILFLFYFYTSEEKEEREVIDMGEGRSFEMPSYSVDEKEEATLLETPNLSLELPEEWKVEEYRDEMEEGVEISSASCVFYLTSYREESELSYLRAKIEMLLEGEIEREGVKLTKVDGIKSVKKSDIGPVRVPFEEKIYEIGTSGRKKECEDLFYKLINSVSVQK